MLFCRALLATVLLLSLAPIGAQDALCTSPLAQADIPGNLNVTVPCELVDVEVRGNVTIFAGGSLTARDTRIHGNLEASRADFIVISESEIDGNVNLHESVGDRSSISDTAIDGNVWLATNRSFLELLNNEIDGNVRAVNNSGGLRISGNAIDGHLECSGNSPAPVGLGNRVDKQSRGQCENLPAELPAQPERPPPPPEPPPGPAPPPPAPPPPTTTPPADGVADSTPPTLSLLGASRISIVVGSPYVDAGATALDAADGDLTSQIVVANPVNTELLGTFTVTYAVSDRSGNAATLTRTVTVEPLPPTGGGGGGALGAEIAWVLMLIAARRRYRGGTVSRSI